MLACRTGRVMTARMVLCEGMRMCKQRLLIPGWKRQVCSPGCADLIDALRPHRKTAILGVPRRCALILMP